jgi:TonB-dependent starch-binding outer membrane protein SusC
MHRTLSRILGGVSLLAALPAAGLAQGTGTITGKVTDRASQQPIGDAQLLVVGTSRGVRTNDQGEYRMVGVPSGTVRLRVLRLGYEARMDTVTLTNGQTVTADFALVQTATRLDQVVVSAIGESERRRENGNSVASITADSIPKPAVNSVSDLLSSRAASVVVTQTSGTTGGGSRIRIRGSNSISLSNEPLIIIDGVRATQDPGGSSISVGGQNPSRLDDLNPDEIENIEIIKGPAAAALYGTAAANGVIQITTKHGKAGPARWSAYVDGGSVRDITDYPANFAQVGRTTSNRRTTGCSLDAQGRGLCTPNPDSLVSFNPLKFQGGPFVDGWREQYGLNVNGGSDLLQYFVGGEFEREQGVYVNNSVLRRGARANLTGQFSPKFDFGVKAGFNQMRLQLPQNDNNDLSPIANAVLGSAFDDPVNHGNIFYPFSVLNQISTDQNVDRLNGALNGSWRPTGWLSVTGLSGLDFMGRDDKQVLGPDLIPGPDKRTLGNVQSNPYSLWTYSANVAATASYRPSASIEASTSIGSQYNKELVRGTQAFGEGLASGTSSLAGTTSGFATTEQNSDIVTLGGFAQQKVAWRDKVFLTAAIRGDDDSNFGNSFKLVTYPSASLSWVIGEEPWFPQSGILSSLRLRTAAGQSGQRPGFRNAITFYNAVGVKRDGSDQGGVEIGANVGNAKLKPELSTEAEGGLDMGLFNSRVNVELTYYSKSTKDALISRQLPPSTGAATRFENLGKVTNKGLEALVSANLLDTRPLKLDITVNGSTNRNRLVTLGQGVDTIFFGLGANNGDFIQRFVEGNPIGGYWQRPIVSFSDKNGDGLISRAGCGATQADNGPNCELILADNAAYLGQPIPTHELSFNTGITLFRNIRVSGLLDHRGGYKIYNATSQFRCVVLIRCQDAFDPHTSLADQARIIASAMGSDAGFVEDASFWKLREVSVTMQAPDTWARRTGASRLSLTLAGRNLATWTNYTGFDPEINWNGTSNFSTAEFLTQPLVRYFTARINASW